MNEKWFFSHEKKPLLFFACPKKSKQKKDLRFSPLAKNPLRSLKCKKVSPREFGAQPLHFLTLTYRIFFTPARPNRPAGGVGGRRRDAEREDLL
jgi:hypothetical protein